MYYLIYCLYIKYTSKEFKDKLIAPPDNTTYQFLSLTLSSTHQVNPLLVMHMLIGDQTLEVLTYQVMPVEAIQNKRPI